MAWLRSPGRRRSRRVSHRGSFRGTPGLLTAPSSLLPLCGRHSGAPRSLQTRVDRTCPRPVTRRGGRVSSVLQHDCPSTHNAPLCASASVGPGVLCWEGPEGALSGSGACVRLLFRGGSQDPPGGAGTVTQEGLEDALR